MLQILDELSSLLLLNTRAAASVHVGSALGSSVVVGGLGFAGVVVAVSLLGRGGGLLLHIFCRLLNVAVETFFTLAPLCKKFEASLSVPWWMM